VESQSKSARDRDADEVAVTIPSCHRRELEKPKRSAKQQVAEASWGRRGVADVLKM
jgi:hypothetical protein